MASQTLPVLSLAGAGASGRRAAGEDSGGKEGDDLIALIAALATAAIGSAQQAPLGASRPARQSSTILNVVLHPRRPPDQGRGTRVGLSLRQHGG
jgi:hypothetical protein